MSSNSAKAYQKQILISLCQSNQRASKVNTLPDLIQQKLPHLHPIRSTMESNLWLWGSIKSKQKQWTRIHIENKRTTDRHRAHQEEILYKIKAHLISLILRSNYQFTSESPWATNTLSLLNSRAVKCQPSLFTCQRGRNKKNRKTYRQE